MPIYDPALINALSEAQRTFVWETVPFPRYERSKSWYFWMTVVAIFLVAYAIWSGNFLFAFLVLLIGIILILAGNEEPSTALIQIGENGVVYAGKLHLFKDLGTFAIVYQPPQTKVLYFETTGLLTPRIRIPLEDQSPVEIRNFLQKYLRENTDLQNEYFSDILARLLKI